MSGLNKDDIIRMAREAGVFREIDGTESMPENSFEEFAKLVAAAEREACAKVCEEAHWSFDDRNEYAAAIRARGRQ